MDRYFFFLLGEGGGGLQIRLIHCAWDTTKIPITIITNYIHSFLIFLGERFFGTFWEYSRHTRTWSFDCCRESDIRTKCYFESMTYLFVFILPSYIWIFSKITKSLKIYVTVIFSSAIKFFCLFVLGLKSFSQLNYIKNKMCRYCFIVH